MSSTRFINCQVCQTEGRILRSNGGPDDIDCGVCPACNGECVVEVDTQPVTPDDWECENCLGMLEHGCYCKAVGAVGPGGPLKPTSVNARI